jgi:Uncharacterized protein conserved in bacteria (DUF2330)
MIRTLSLLVLALLLGVWGSPLTAQERESAGVIQTSLDALYIVDTANDSTTAYYSVTYVRQESPARWVFALPKTATSVEVIDSDFFNQLEVTTDPYIEPGWSPCELSRYSGSADGYLPFPQVMMAEADIPERLADEIAIRQWLRTGSATTPNPERIQAYLEAGFAFIGLESQTPQAPPRDYSTTSINLLRSPSIRVTYPGTELQMPILHSTTRLETHLSNYDDDGRMPVTVYIMADSPYTTGNYVDVPIDLNQIDGGYNLLRETIRRTEPPYLFFLELDPQYHALVTQGLAAVEGLGMVTELRLPQSDWVDYPRSHVSEVLQVLPSSGGWLTRLRTYTDANANLPDPGFIPKADAAPFDMNLATEVDPARFWGCSSRWLIDDALEARLPSGRTYIEPLRQYVAHPEDWVMTELSETVYAFAPVPLDWDMVTRMEYGGDELPMLLLEKFALPYYVSAENQPDAECKGCSYEAQFSNSPPNPAFNWFRRANDPIPQGVPMRNAISIYWPLWNGSRPVADMSYDPVAQGVRAVTMSTVDDWAANGALYNDMLTYLTQYQFYTSGQLRYTLFLGDLSRLLELGYPERWIETVDNNGSRYIHPEGIEPISDGPYIFIPRPIGRDVATQIQTSYGVERFTPNTPVPFQTDTRRGYVVQAPVVIYTEGIIEISAPIDRYPEYADTLDLIAQSMRICDQCPETQ